MSDYSRQGLQQFTDDKAKESKENKIEKDVNKFSASEFGERTERYNANEKKAEVKKDVKTNEEEEKEILTEKEMDKQDEVEDLEQAYINNKAKPIEGLRIFDSEDKAEMKRLYNLDKKFVSVASMGVSIENGHGLYRGGFDRINFVNSKLGSTAPKVL